ncbi:beta-1,3-galactosyltransferase 1-like [Ylistrum balloti]|uniref:beta-1,3-galactosyltransferase 1-like n=1 Tax=Ylistrum balloti TaxID=509963 RepID=UPI002905E38D|nr:beta-1,3-galactosyltransferase 1-like [Ylistrum balloti]XP_060081094.1 beta-1,3-galactosyltransferase 1-like [Ylistrum balloti]
MAKRYLLKMILPLFACVLVYIWLNRTNKKKHSELLLRHSTKTRLRDNSRMLFNMRNTTELNLIGHMNFNNARTTSIESSALPSPSSLSEKRTPMTSLTATTTPSTSTKPTTTIDPLARLDNCSNCFLHNFNFIHVNKDICSVKQTSNIDVVILISTTPGNRHKREVIRRTWLNISKNNTSNVRYVFLLGSQSNKPLKQDITREFAKYKDIVQEDFIDSYNNLTLKTLMGFKWANLFCSSAKFVMKTDDDVYVNVRNLLESVKNHEKQLENSVGGYCKHVALPVRDSRFKWYASLRQYPRSVYPGYCSGTGYVTSMTTMRKVYTISKDVPFFYLEDVYISLCIEQLSDTLTSLQGFNPVLVPLDSCVYKGPYMVTSHGLTPENMVSMFTQDCITENTTRIDNI